MHMNSIWRDDRIHSVDLDRLSPMSYHPDERWRTRDLPRMHKDGMWYPLLYYKVTFEWWDKKFRNWFGGTPAWPYINPPTVNNDGYIWALKIGCNRYLCLKHMGYTSADCIIFSDVNELIQTAIYYREQDPLHNV